MNCFFEYSYLHFKQSSNVSNSLQTISNNLSNSSNLFKHFELFKLLSRVAKYFTLAFLWPGFGFHLIFVFELFTILMVNVCCSKLKHFFVKYKREREREREREMKFIFVLNSFWGWLCCYRQCYYLYNMERDKIAHKLWTFQTLRTIQTVSVISKLF